MGGAVGIILAILAMVFPFFGGIAAGQSLVNSACDCVEEQGDTCSEEDKKAFGDAVKAIGVVVAYLAYGWVCVILGIVGVAMAGAACCGCCKAKAEEGEMT